MVCLMPLGEDLNGRQDHSVSINQTLFTEMDDFHSTSHHPQPIILNEQFPTLFCLSVCVWLCVSMSVCVIVQVYH